jgi:peroxiredoxin Q/BCP
VSLDTLDTHQAFAERHKLNFPLVVDRDRKLANAFGVTRLWGLVPFVKRVTFVIDAEGIVRKVIASEFDIDRHVDEAIAALRDLRPAA